MTDPGPRSPARALGATFRIGTIQDVAWIDQDSSSNGGAAAGIPPIFTSYCVIRSPTRPRPPGTQSRHDRAIIGALRAHGAEQPWWLGYLDMTGGGDYLPAPDAPRVRLYSNWDYVFIEGGPDQALALRLSEGPDASPYGALPDVIFPKDRSWLYAVPWGEGWSAVGGPEELVAHLLANRELEGAVTRVAWGDPPGDLLAR